MRQRYRTVELTPRFLPAMLERKQGRILNIASIAGFLPGPFMATYYASKNHWLQPQTNFELIGLAVALKLGELSHQRVA
jgi:hypothetical protein